MLSRLNWIINTICNLWGKACYEVDTNPQSHEATFLKLDCSKAKSQLGWRPKWNIETTLEKIIAWTKAYHTGENMRLFCEKQIQEYLKD
jgi:CDP-glucose 4,6-dehydratase